MKTPAYSVEKLPPLGVGHGLGTGKQSLRLSGVIYGRRAVLNVRHNMESPLLFRFECEVEDSSDGSAQWIEHASGSIGATDDIDHAADVAWQLCENYEYRRGSPYLLNREVIAA
jgi:hypothetical protein